MSGVVNDIYRIKEECIKVIPALNEFQVKIAFNEGYAFVQVKDVDKYYKIKATLRMNALCVDMINADIVSNDGTIKESRADEVFYEGYSLKEN